jgi:hypothetical protein
VVERKKNMSRTQIIKNWNYTLRVLLLVFVFCGGFWIARIVPENFLSPVSLLSLIACLLSCIAIVLIKLHISAAKKFAMAAEETGRYKQVDLQIERNSLNQTNQNQGSLRTVPLSTNGATSSPVIHQTQQFKPLHKQETQQFSPLKTAPGTIHKKYFVIKGLFQCGTPIFWRREVSRLEFVNLCASPDVWWELNSNPKLEWKSVSFQEIERQRQEIESQGVEKKAYLQIRCGCSDHRNELFFQNGFVTGCCLHITPASTGEVKRQLVYA